jgi:hypothetical protein
MRLPVLIVLSTFMACSGSVSAETVFRCTENGKTIFTESATGPACRPLDIRADPADSEDVARRQQESQEWNRRREEIVQQGLARDAMVEAQRRRAEITGLGRGETRSSGYSEFSGRRSHDYRRRARTATPFP